MSVIDELLNEAPEPQRKTLERIRDIVKLICPGAKEVITYGMPGFTYQGKYLIAFGNFRNHMSLFPGSEPIEQLKESLTGYKTSRGTIQFTLEHRLTDGLVQNIVELCMARIEQTGKRTA